MNEADDFLIDNHERDPLYCVFRIGDVEAFWRWTACHCEKPVIWNFFDFGGLAEPIRALHAWIELFEHDGCAVVQCYFESKRDLMLAKLTWC